MEYYRVEYALSGRSKCKVCHRTMAKGEMRIGCCQSENDHFGECLGWYCFQESKPCLWKTFGYKKIPNPRITSVEEIKYFECLEENDQERLRKFVEEPPAKKARLSLPHSVEQLVYLDSDFSEKDEVKALGARWDRDQKAWYVPAGMALEPFKKWICDESFEDFGESLVEGRTQESHDTYVSSSIATLLPEFVSEPVFLHCRFDEKDAVKAFGARWNSSQKSWYVPSGTPLAPFTKWINVESVASAARSTTEAATSETKTLPQNNIAAVGLPEASSQPVLLKSAFSEKDEVKALGARWDKNQASWYVPVGAALKPFAKWIVPEAAALAVKASCAITTPPGITSENSSKCNAQEKLVESVAKSGCVVLPEASSEPVLLKCDFNDKGEVKSLGARWDACQGSWYVPAGRALAPFTKWVPADAAAEAMRTSTLATSACLESAKPLGKSTEPVKPQGKPKKLSQKTLKSIQKEENNLESLTIAKLKEMLKLNDQTITGTKPELISKVAEGIVLGAIPRCPSCNGGKPSFDRVTGLYTCKGHMDDSTFIYCAWSSYGMSRTAWQ